jgi:hypothetical protein
MSALSLHQLRQKSLLAFYYRLFSLIGRDGGMPYSCSMLLIYNTLINVYIVRVLFKAFIKKIK